MLLVLRHGQTTWNLPPTRCQGQLDVPLSEAGRAASLEVGASLPIPQAAYASHLIRARETAALLIDGATGQDPRLAPPLFIDPRLAEAHCGRWQGIEHEVIRRVDAAAWAQLASESPDFCFPQGESLAAVLSRFTAAIAELDARHRGELALVVAHGGPIRLFLGHKGMLASREPGTTPKNLEGFRLEAHYIEMFRARSAR